tara:strand:- start:1545 stop:2003 length:459 start_codon:yes stop_codon:yes gene_type:complete
MSKVVHTWARVERGDVISFRYQGSDGQSTKRTLIVLERRLKHPKTKNFLLHGIQLEVRNVPAIKSEPVLIEMFQEVGQPVKVDMDKNIIRLLVTDQNPQIYTRIKDMIKRYGIYRTYNYEKATRVAVYREPVKIDPKILDRLSIDTLKRSAR